MTAETSNKYKPPQNPPSPRELAQGLSQHVNVLLPELRRKAEDQADLPLLIGIAGISRHTSTDDFEWMFDGAEETDGITEEDAVAYIEDRLSPEHDQHLADVARELYAQAGSLEPRAGSSRVAIQVEQDERGIHHTRVVGVSDQSDAHRIVLFEPESACVRASVYDLGREWTGGEDFIHDGRVMTGYLPDDFRGEDGGPKARTEASDGKVHYRSRDPEAYLNFALHNGFSNEYPTELPENLLL